jgi:hypothetical protein
MDGNEDMKFNLRPTFTLVALFPFLVAAFLAGCAQAAGPNIADPNVKELNFTQIENNAQNRQKYPFVAQAYSDLKLDDPSGTSKVYVAEVNKDISIEYIDGPNACGIYCQIYGYTKTKSGFNENLEALARTPVYVQTCPDTISLITTGGNKSMDGVTQWIYAGGRFDKHVTTWYPSLDKVPACGPKK